jgi:cytochrome c oxidase subunit 2
MILTREKRGNGQAGIFCRSIGLVAVMLAALLPASPAWSQEENAAAPAAAPVAPEAEAAEKPLLWMPEAISTYGQGVDDLFWLIFWITGVAWVIVMGLMLYFLIRYRHREGREKAHYTHGNNKLEVTWTLATVVILVFIGVVQLWGESGWFNIRISLPEMGKDTFPVRVYGEQFAWHFNYPGADGKFGEQRHGYIQAGINPIGLDRDGPGKDDKVLPKLVVPEGKKVLIQLISLGKYNLDTEIYTHPVLHSFFSPHLRLKMDLVPYNEGNIWFEVEAGKGHAGKKFEIVCAELCGEGHSKMRADFEILDEAGLLKELGYDWNAQPAKEFPVVVHYYQEEKDEE